MGIRLSEDAPCAICVAVDRGEGTFDHRDGMYPVCQKHLNMTFDQLSWPDE